MPIRCGRPVWICCLRHSAPRSAHTETGTRQAAGTPTYALVNRGIVSSGKLCVFDNITSLVQVASVRQNGTALAAVSAHFCFLYGSIPLRSNACAVERSIVNSRYGLGRRFTARGSTRPERFPTVLLEMPPNAELITAC